MAEAKASTSATGAPELGREEEVLVRVTVNYLYLAQFETFRASLKTLRDKNPGLALSVLQTVVERGGALDGPVAWSARTRSPAQLAFLALSELIEIDEGDGACLWGLDPDSLKLKAEFLLLIDSIKESIVISHDDDEDNKESTLTRIGASLCDAVADEGVQRLRGAVSGLGITEAGYNVLSDDEMQCWRDITLRYPQLVDDLCRNIRAQVGVDLDCFLTVSVYQGEGEGEGSSGFIDDFPLGLTLRREAQRTHLELIKDALQRDDIDACIDQLRFLRVGDGVELLSYRGLIIDLCKRIITGVDSFGESWNRSRERMLRVYEKLLASEDIQLIKMVAGIQNDLIKEAAEAFRVSNESTFPPPLKKLITSLQSLRSQVMENSGEKTAAEDLIIRSSKRELFHYAHVTGEHIFDIVLKAAVVAIKNERLEDASDVLAIFPRLQPLMAAMGWDLLSGKTLARRKLMEVLWTSKSNQLRIDDLSVYGKQGEEVSCVDYLCNHLCYRLELAYFAACKNSGHDWDSKTSLIFSGRKGKGSIEDIDGGPLDPFVANLVLERLAVQSPLRVLFDVVPYLKFHNVLELLNMQPIYSPQAAWQRIQDVEMLHMHYAIQSTVLALGLMERNMPKVGSLRNTELVWCYLKDLEGHMEAVGNLPRKLFLTNIIIALLHMDGLSVSQSFYEINIPETRVGDKLNGDVLTPDMDISEKQMAISVVSFFLKLLYQSIPSEGVEIEIKPQWNGVIEGSVKQSLEWKATTIKQFVEDWEWRLSALKCLLPSPDCHWTWKEALAILRAAPSTLLNLCMQRAQYEIGEQAVKRFGLPPEDKAALQLAEWVDGAFTRASIEDVMSRVATGAMNEESSLDFAAFRSQLGSLATGLLCTDAAITSARSVAVAKQLLQQAWALISEISVGDNEKLELSHWEQVQELCIIAVAKRIVQRLQDFLEQSSTVTVQGLLTGNDMRMAFYESYRQSNRYRALISLDQVIEDAIKGKRQFLSGKLHNLVKAMSDEEFDEASARLGSNYLDKKASSGSEHDILVGLGLRPVRQTSSAVPVSEQFGENVNLNTKGVGKRFQVFSSKSLPYLSAFIQYIATIGDIVDGIDTTHDFNYFTLVYDWPSDVLTRLVFERGSEDAAGKIADIMGADLVHEIISACVPPVYAPRTNQGWACIPSIPYSHFESDSGFSSTSSKNKFCRSFSSKTTKSKLYPLRLDVVKHLSTLSPVRAVLACVFGSMFSPFGKTISGKDSEVSVLSEDDERTFYEFALDQSYRFPTLNRWIQMQANIHRLLDSPITSKPASEARVQIKAENRSFRKRHRDYTNETEPEEDEGINGGFVATPSKVSVGVESKDDKAACSAQNEEKELKASEPESCGYLYFDWENEGPYEEAVERLIAEGKLLDALALSDRCLKDGASDHLLQFLIEREEGYSRSNQLNSHGMRHNVWSNTWQYCIRLRDKRLAATLALKYLHHWELSAAMDVLTMCCCHLSPHDSLRSEVLRMKEALEKYKHILNADGQYFSWQEVEADFKEDPEGLALRLAAKGAVSAALAVAESASLPIELRRELQGRQLVKLLTTDPVSGGGPAEASRFLSSLREPEDALPVAMGAMQQLPNLRSKRLLVHFILKHRAGALSDADNAQLNRWALGLKVLAALPLPWQQRCSALHEHPHLILETLLMWKQLQSAQELVKEFPSLRDKDLIFKYAAKAITVTAYPYVERHTATVPVTSQHNSRSTMSAKLNFSSSISNFQKEARKAFSWAKSDNGNKLVPKEVTRKRKNSALPFSQRVAWEAMTGMQEERGNFMSTDGQERHTSVAITEGWVLTGDSVKDESVRQSHRYESAPDIILFKALLSLCLDDVVAAKGAIDLCTVEMEDVLSSSKLPLKGSTETVSRAYHATETFVQALSHAKAQLKLIIGRTESTLKEHKSLDVDDTSSDTGTGTSSISSGPDVELTELLSQADLWLGHAKLLQSLLGSGVVASLDDVRDRQSATLLRDRLLKEERYSMAVYTCKMCKIDAFAVWNAWGQALLRMEHYDQARVKLGKAIQLYKDKPVPVVLDIINIMESGPPVDIAGVRSLYNHLAKSAPTIVDDSLSADSYLNVLYMPSSFPRSERLRKPSEGSTDIYKQISAQGAGDDEPRSNLDSVRYMECVKYLEEYAREELLAFMFRHGRYSDACMLFFPANSMPLPPQSPPSQKTDPLATDYGSIDDLCALCVGYGAMDVLEHVIAVRNDGPSSIDSAIKEHTSAALTKICNYCEIHRHFNHLYRFQVLKNDHIAAGLCSIQLFLNSSNQDQALKHLEHAKMHFDEGFAARHKAGESNRMIAKTARMKSASDKLTEDELLKFSARIGIQMEVVRSFSDADGPPWKHSLFGNPNDTETFRRRCEVAETLVERNFDLAFRIIHLFELPACHIYAGVAASIAERKKGNQLTDFLKNIKGTVDDVDWDQILGAAINVFANKHRERPDRLIDMLSSNHRKVLACVVCGRLKTAFQIASRSGNVADVQYVAHQAMKTGAHPVLDMCKQWLAQYM